MTEDREEKETNGRQETVRIFKYIHKSPVLRVALDGMSELINTRLSSQELDICFELIEAGVHPQALAQVILHVLEAKQKHVIGSQYDTR